MFESRTEIIGWGAAILVVAVMGVLVAAGPFHKINKPVAKSSFAPIQVKIVNDPKSIGKYTPPTITAHPGQKITWVNVSNQTHTVTGRGDNSFNSQDIQTGSSFSLTTPAKAGVYKYYCVYHPLMLGSITVKR